MLFSKTDTNATRHFPKTGDYELDTERESWMEANASNWPFFYDVLEWPCAFGKERSWELSEAFIAWLHKERDVECCAHYGLLCFAEQADALAFCDRFAPKATTPVLYRMG